MAATAASSSMMITRMSTSSSVPRARALSRNLTRCAMRVSRTHPTTTSTSTSSPSPSPSPSSLFSTTSRQRRPPAAEPAVVKAPSEPPNPVAWPGSLDKQTPRGRGDEGVASQSSSQSSPSDVPHAESSKAAVERQQRAQREQEAAAARKSSSSGKDDAAACATLSPSSPAAPRSQGKDKGRGVDAEVNAAAAAPKALAPEAASTSTTTSTPSSSPPSSSSSSSTPPAPSPTPASADKKAAISAKLNSSGKAFRAKKEALRLTPTAIERLKGLLESDGGPRLIRIGVRNKGCAGMSYHLEYVTPDQAGKFDERVRQDGVEVLIDSKALFSIIGSEMDWQEDTLSAKFVFNNPNVKESCGCGESFLT